jgi:hypothetical protein
MNVKFRGVIQGPFSQSWRNSSSVSRMYSTGSRSWLSRMSNALCWIVWAAYSRCWTDDRCSFRMK